MAGLIPQAFIDELLNRVDIAEVIESRVPMKRAGRNYKGLCPFHKEKSPSFTVNSDKQFYYCFGCGAGGNAIGFLMDYERMEFPQAVENLANTAGLEVPREENDRSQTQRNNNKPIYELLELCTQHFQQQLRQHSQAQQAVNYLKSRGLTGQIAKQFGVGYAPPGWDNIIVALGDDEAKKTSHFTSRHDDLKRIKKNVNTTAFAIVLCTPFVISVAELLHLVVALWATSNLNILIHLKHLSLIKVVNYMVSMKLDMLIVI
jgi:DNA primase